MSGWKNTRNSYTGDPINILLRSNFCNFRIPTDMACKTTLEAFEHYIHTLISLKFS